MRPLTCFTFVCVLLSALACAHAETAFDGAARAKAAGAIVDEETAVVAHIDLARMQPKLLIDFLSDLLPQVMDNIRRDQDRLRGWCDALRGAGVREVYFAITPVDLLQGPPTPWTMSWAIGVSSAEQEKAVRAALRLPEGDGQVPNGVLAIPRRGQKSLQTIKRPELAAAFEAAGDAAIQFVVVPPRDWSRVVEELMPEMPKALGGGPTTVVTRGFEWAAVGLDLAPKKGLRLVVKSPDANAAEALKAKLVEALRVLGQRKDVRDLAPKFDEAAAMLVPKVEGDRLVLDWNEENHGLDKFLAALAPPIEVMRAASARYQSMNNLKQIALAMHNYYSANKHFPSPASRGPDGKPLLSWRVHILPYIEGNSVYHQFHLDEPWDSAHNRTLIDKMPAVYRLPISKNMEPGRTNYLLPVGGGAGFTMDKPTEFKDIRDGTSNTIMVVEVDDQHAVIWTKPEDWPFDPKEPTKGLAHFFNGGFNTALFDGSVTFFTPHVDAKSLRARFTRAGGEVGW
jgi:hypothetical protein